MLEYCCRRKRKKSSLLNQTVILQMMFYFYLIENLNQMNESRMLPQILPSGFMLQYCHHTLISNSGSPGNPAVEEALSPRDRVPWWPATRERAWEWACLACISSFSLYFTPLDFYLMMMLYRVTVKSNQVRVCSSKKGPSSPAIHCILRVIVQSLNFLDC